MNSSNKRRDTRKDDTNPKRMKKECDYGERCYRRNPAHFREFSHPHLEAILDVYEGTGPYPIPEKYGMDSFAMTEQLDVIVAKQLYTPVKRDETKQGLGSDATVKPLGQDSLSNPTGGTSSSTAVNLRSPVKNTPSQKQTNQNTLQIPPKKTTTSTKIGDGQQKSPILQGTQRSSPIPQGTQRNSPIPQGSQRNSPIPQGSQRNSPIPQGTQRNSPIPQGSQRNSPIPQGTQRKSPIPQAVSQNSSKQDTSRAQSPNNSVHGQKMTEIRNKNCVDYRPIVTPARRVEDYLNVVVGKGKMAAKHDASAPYHIFYTTITAAKETHNQPYSITFQEILDHSLGELRCSLQINFMVEPAWLLAQYYFAGYSEKRLTILYGEECSDLRDISKKKPQVDAHLVQMATPFGKHHTKMMVLCYEDGSLRVVVSTANLYVDDWENRTQGLWLSPRCPELPATAMPHDGESPTMFKRSLLRYLSHYYLPALSPYIERVKRCDFSHINVFLVTSAPGSHFDTDWGMTRVGSLLRQHCAIPANETRRWPLLAQASSIGSYGNKPNLWLTGDFLHHFTKIKDQPQMLSGPPELKLIYPSLENVQHSHDGLLGGGCLPYAASAHSKQPWLNEFLFQWRARSTKRDRAMPHIKSYTRTSPDNNYAAYFLLTSGNVSKAAWGSINKGNAALRIMSYEAGVLFLPKFIINEDLFPLQETAKNRLVLPYDVPPTKYTKEMSPWVSDYLCG